MTHVGHGPCDVISRSAQLLVEADGIGRVCEAAVRLFDACGACPSDVRGVGVHISSLEPVTTPCWKSPPEAVAGKSAVLATTRVVLHLDCDCFFLSVHRRHDPSLRNAGPLVLWQYNDVICVSPEAKAAGVRKHMRPSDAQPLVDAVGGRMVHAFARRWPGPRVWYGPYTQCSRDVLHFIQCFLNRELCLGGFVLERASIDEVFVDVS